MTVEARERFSADLREMVTLRHWLEATGMGWQADADELADVILAVDELATNITEHGYQGQGGTIEVEARRRGRDLVVILRDQAPSFDPADVPPPDLTLPIEERPIGGMGLHLARNMVDELKHQPRPEGGNEITLVKRAVFG